jgi:triacylglycerol lipase
MARTHHIYLVPGFLGFANLGRITYFGHVSRILTERLEAMGLDPHIHVVRTSPTASLPARAARVAEVIDATARRGGAPLHLIGHSSGGLDVRLLTAPGVGLPTALDVERIASRVRTVVTIATPHHGTPLASLFTTLRGQQLLQLISLNTVYVLNFGHLPLAAALWMGSLLVRFGGLVANSNVLDELFGRLLEDFTPSRRRAVRDVLKDVVRDQALMLQLTPEAMEVFNASVLQRAGIRYGAVVGKAARPTLRSTLGVGLDPGAQVTHALFSALYRIIQVAPGRVSPPPAPAVARVLRRAYREVPSADANDGIVPTLSQAWGQVIHAALADHLDVLGHFRDASRHPPHVDWLVSGSGFDRGRFDALWSDVAHFLVAAGRKQPKRRRAARRPRVGGKRAGTKRRRSPPG